MSESSSHGVSGGPKRARAGGVICPERSRLREQLQAIEKELDDLVEEQFKAFRANDQKRFWQLNQKLEPMRARQELAQVELRKHIRTHRCQPLDAPMV